MLGKGEAGPSCCCSSERDFRMLVFPDGGRAGVVGLEVILAEMAAAGRPVVAETAEEIVKRLAKRNYIAAGSRRQYSDLLLKEYQTYVASHGGSRPDDKSPTGRGV